ncbi:MAG: DUF2256 domain-containing protein [Hyphomonadaceae bacterium]|nr:DUF2256 domain-containing protein [Hyphomonadaceae bacterium]
MDSRTLSPASSSPGMASRSISSRRTKRKSTPMGRRAEKPTPSYRKPNLPHKDCAVCAKPFAWRKKWARDWDNVKYCSERCRRNATASKPSAVLANKSETTGRP